MPLSNMSSCRFLLSGDLLEPLVPHPEFRLLGLRNIPQMPESSLAFSSFSWPGLLKHLRQILIAKAHMEEGKQTPLTHL